MSNANNANNANNAHGADFEAAIDELTKEVYEWSGGHAPHEIDEDEWFEAQGDDTERNRILFAMAVEQSIINAEQ